MTDQLPKGLDEDREKRELWWIFSPLPQSWANMRVATFSTTTNGSNLVVIHNEVGHRVGVRIWDDIVKRELWFKVKKIEPPTAIDVIGAALKEGIKLTENDVD